MQTTNAMDEKRQMLNDIAYVGTDICESVLMIEILWIQLIQALQNHKIVFQNIQLGTRLSHKQQKRDFFMNEALNSVMFNYKLWFVADWNSSVMLFAWVTIQPTLLLWYCLNEV